MFYFFILLTFSCCFGNQAHCLQNNQTIEQKMIQHIHILGEKCSGTTFLKSLLLNNIEGISIHNLKTKNHYLPKHRFVDDNKLKGCANCLFIHLHRNPYDWIRSFYGQPQHSLESLRDLSFSTWIRSPWKSFYGKPSKRAYEVNPDTKKTFANIIELRTKKLQHFEDLKNKVTYFYSIDYDSVNAAPETFLHSIASLFSLKKKSNYNPVIMYKGNQGQTQERNKVFKQKKYLEFSKDDITFINNQLDWKFENSLGYQLNQFNQDTNQTNSENMSIQKPTSIDHIHIIGEKSSGTSFVKCLLINNLVNGFDKLTVTGKNHIKRHRFLNDDQIKNCNNCLFLHITRNPYTWVRSLYLNKEHQPKSFHNLSFSKWIRKKWKHIYRKDNQGNKKTIREKNPENGKSFRNILKLRSKKLAHFEQLATQVNFFCSTSYEAINENPQIFLKYLSYLFCLPLKKDFIPVITYKGKDEPYQKKEYFNFLAKDLEFINNELDWNLEDNLGYKKNQLDGCSRPINLLQAVDALLPTHQDPSNNAINLEVDLSELN